MFENVLKVLERRRHDDEVAVPTEWDVGSTADTDEAPADSVEDLREDADWVSHAAQSSTRIGERRLFGEKLEHPDGKLVLVRDLTKDSSSSGA